MSDGPSPARHGFNRNENLAWMTGTSAAMSSNEAPTSDPMGQDWQAFMTYDHLSPTAPIPLSYLLPPEATSAVSESSSSRPITSPSAATFPLSQDGSTSATFSFVPDQISQNFFTSPGFGSHVSPYSDTSRQLSDDLDMWKGKDILGATSIADPRTTLSPTSDVSPTAVHVSSNAGRASAKQQHTSLPPPVILSPSSRKRKQSEDEDDPLNDLDEERPGVKKSAHNMIEKRYRNNLNDKIAALRDAVPSLRSARRSASDGDDNEAEDLEGLAPAHKLNKATVLSKATEYIRHLEKHKLRQEQEISELRARLTTIERMVKAGRQVFHSPMGTPSEMIFQEDVFAASSGMASSSQAPPNGMIPIPENIANMRQAQIPQDPYNMPHTSYPAYAAATGTAVATTTAPRANGISRNGLFGRVMLTGLTTIMLLEGLREQEQQGNDQDARGLFSFPMSILKNHATGSSSSGISRATGLPFFGLVRMILLFVSTAYILASVFGSRRTVKTKTAQQVVIRTPYSLASPVELRQTAWLTAIQTVWVPNRVMALELMALCLKMIKLSIRKLFGSAVYTFVTGSTKEHETARIKAWQIAMDAQLSGGDAEISTSRLLLTFLASGTLPSTPACLMLKALHIRILLWRLARSSYGTWHFVDAMSRKLAEYYWNAARTEYHTRSTRTDSPTPDEESDLPEHLAKLLELSSDEVLIDAIVQRCFNLAYNKPTANRNEESESMDNVVEDIHIASPLDALAAWWSTTVVNQIMTHVIETPPPINSSALLDDMELALQVAPPPSAARIRACVAKALLNKQDREACIQDALAILPYPKAQSEHTGSSSVPSCVNLVAEAPVAAEITITLSIVKCLALAEISDPTLHNVARAYIKYYLPAQRTHSLLTFAAALQLLEHTINLPDPTPAVFAGGLEALASNLRLFIGSSLGARLGLSDRARTCATERCLGASKQLSGVVDNDDTSSDQGYVSQMEEDDYEQVMEDLVLES